MKKSQLNYLANGLSLYVDLGHLVDLMVLVDKLGQVK
jgi:hypothetical protein